MITTKIGSTVAVATVTATASAHAANELTKRDDVDQDNSVANVAILADENKNMKPSLRVEGQESDMGMLVTHAEQLEEKPLKNQQRRRAKVLPKDDSSRSFMDLGILDKNREQQNPSSHHRHLHSRHHDRGLKGGYVYSSLGYVYWFQLYLQSDIPSAFSLDLCFTFEDGYYYCLVTDFPIENIEGDDNIYFPLYRDARAFTIRFFVEDTETYPCGVPGGLHLFLCQIDGSPFGYQGLNCFETLIDEEGLLDVDDTDCDTEISFTVAPVPASSSKSSKSYKSYKSSKSRKGGFRP